MTYCDRHCVRLVQLPMCLTGPYVQTDFPVTEEQSADGKGIQAKQDWLSVEELSIGFGTVRLA